MGRILPPSTQKLFDIIPELKGFYGVLRRSDELIFDEFFENIDQHQEAIGNATDMLPIEILPWAILLEGRKRNGDISNELYSRIERLKNTLKELESPEEPD